MRKLRSLTMLVTSVSVAVLPGLQTMAQAAPPPTHGTAVQVWLSDVSTDTWVERQNDVSFQTKQATNPLTIKVDDSVRYQEITGFGAALTDSSAWVMNELPAESRDELMKNLFDPVDGAGLNMIRVPMGATDFTASEFYSYDDLPKGETDPTLSNFSVAHDEAYIIPQLQQALALNPGIKVTATPWSPPGWMKTSDDLVGGSLKTEYEPVLAQYFVKFIQAYGEAGLPIHYVTPQNEPQAAPSWPGMEMTPSQQARVIKEMGDAFAANDISTEILSWDHNWDVPSYPEAVYNDPASADYAVGAAWHIYSGSPIYQTFAHNDYPAKRNYLTEATGGTYQANTEVAFHDAFNTWVIDNMRNWGNGVMLWNIALDPEGGPLSGIPLNRGLVAADPETGSVSYNSEYYALAHASKFVEPGAHRIYSNSFGAGSVENVAFQNPDGSKVMLAYNDSDESQAISVADGTQSFDYTLEAGNAVTFTYSGPTQKGRKSAAPNVVDSNHDFVFDAATAKGRGTKSKDEVTITYDPDLLPIQNTVVNGDGLLTYSLPVGASITPPGAELDRSGWTIEASASSEGDEAANAIDGDVHTKWRTGIRAKNGDHFQVDLGASTTVTKIVLDNSEEDAFEAIADYQVYVSEDGEDWGTAVARGRGPFGSVSIALEPQTARYIRIVSTDDSFHFHWSVGEVKVYGVDSASSSFASPTKVSKPLQLKGWTSPDGAKVSVVYNGSRSEQSFRVSADGSYSYSLPPGTSAMFTTHERPESAVPAFGTLAPSRGLPGYRLTITGAHFGETQDWGTVFFGAVPARIESWSDTRIIAIVPRGLPSGKYQVSVNGSGGEPAGGAPFTLRGLGTPLDRDGWTATASDVSPWPADVVEHVLDGDIDTRYASGTGQYDGMSLQVDMGQPQTFNRVVLDAGSSFGDTARSADIYVSSDGQAWTKVTSVLASGQPVQLASFPEQTARYIKVVNTRNAGNWWSIAEFGVYNNTEPDPEPDPEAPLARDGWSATASDESPWPNDALVHMLDGDTSSRYTSGTGQYDGMWVQVDMGAEKTFNKVELDPGSSTDDYARSADIYVSSDGTAWTQVASIAGPGQPTQVATFATQTARYIKVVNTGSAGNWWSITEFNVYYDPDQEDPLTRDGWSATASDESPWPDDALVHMLDGDAISRYSSGTSQYAGMWFQIDMGAAQTFSRVELDSGPNADDYARSADVYVSENGVDWTKVASIEADGQPVQTASFPTQTSRYVKVVNTGSAGNWWSVTEFNVYE
ncbi:discoidin domain-containing protein [Nocardioides dilutus]